MYEEFFNFVCIGREAYTEALTIECLMLELYFSKLLVLAYYKYLRMV